MKLEKKESIYITNVEETQSDNFSFHDEGIIMSLIQDKMYQKKLYTPIQEVISNARDAVRERHLESLDPNLVAAMSEDDLRNKIAELYSNDQHISITLPNGLNPVLIIRDYGVGISPQRLVLIKRVGASTKNNSDLHTGGFGLGLKSVFAYTEQFFIISYFNGIEYTYVCQKNVSKMGAIVLLSEVETTERNGVEIKIPIKSEDSKNISTHISEIIRFWDAKPLINNISLKGEDDLFTLKHGSLAPRGQYHLAVIDGIPYQLDLHRYCDPETITSKLKDRKLVMFFNTGEVDLVMTREGLEDSVKNKDAIAKRISDLLVEIEEYCLLKLTAAKAGLKDYSVVYNELMDVFILDKVLGKNTLTFQILVDDFVINIEEEKVKFTFEDRPITFNILTSEGINSRRGSDILSDKRAIFSSSGEFLLRGDSKKTFSNISVSTSEADKRINSYSERKKREIYALNRSAICNGYIYVMHGDLEDQCNSPQERILNYLMNEFSLSSVTIKYPVNLTVLEDLNVFYYNKKTMSITIKEKSCKLNGKTKFTRYKTTSNELREICSKINDKYSISKEMFFSLLSTLNIELVYIEEDVFPVFQLETFDKLLTSNISGILNEGEVIDYFINIYLKNVQKTFGLWSAIHSNQAKVGTTNVEIVSSFILNELKNMSEAKSEWKLSTHERNEVKSKIAYYRRMFSNNGVLYDKMAFTFQNALKLDQILDGHPMIKDGVSSHYSFTSNGCLLLKNYIDYINVFFKEDKVEAKVEDVPVED